MAWASCETASNHSTVKPDRRIGVNTELVKYAYDRGETTTLVFVDGDQLHIKGSEADYRKARAAAVLEDARSWGS